MTITALTIIKLLWPLQWQCSFFSPLDSSVLKFYNILSVTFATTSRSPSPSFLNEGLHIKLHFSAVSNLILQYSVFLNLLWYKKNPWSAPLSTRTVPCHVTVCVRWLKIWEMCCFRIARPHVTIKTFFLQYKEIFFSKLTCFYWISLLFLFNVHGNVSIV